MVDLPELTEQGPMRAALVVWRRSRTQWAITVCVKGTFVLGPDGELAAEQDAPSGDRYLGGDEQATLGSAAEIVPGKPRVDVTLNGSAYAPARAAPAQLVARLEVAGISKAVHVFGDRRWQRLPNGSLEIGQQPLTAVPLRFERGPRNANNPIGFDPEQTVRYERPTEDFDTVELHGDSFDQTIVFGPLAAANLEVEDGASPCFAPLPIAWRAERMGLSQTALAWAGRFCAAPSAKVTVIDEPPPDDFDFAIFNAAPPELQLAELPPGATIVLEHLSRKAAVARAVVPTLAPRVRRGASALALRCDTIAIDADLGRITLVWRSTVDVDDPSVERFTVSSGAAAAKLAAPPLLMTQDVDVVSVRVPALPFVRLAEVETPSPSSALSPPVDPTPPAWAPTETIAAEVGAAPPVTPDSAVAAPASGPPSHAFPIARYAAIVAALEATPPRRAEILATYDTTAADFTRLERRFAHEVQHEAGRGRRDLQDAFDAAYAREKRRPPGDLTVADYAFVVVSVERGEIDRVLAALGVPLATLMQIQKSWRRRLAQDRDLSIEVERAVAIERRRLT